MKKMSILITVIILKVMSKMIFDEQISEPI